MSPTLVRPFREQDRTRVVALWHACGLVRPWNDPDRDIDRKLAHDATMLLVAVEDDSDDDSDDEGVVGTMIGTVMVGYDGHRGWINYLAVAPDRRRDGIGRVLMGHADQRLEALGCAKVNLQIRADNVAAVEFYQRLGYSVDGVVSMGRRLIDDATAASET